MQAVSNAVLDDQEGSGGTLLSPVELEEEVSQAAAIRFATSPEGIPDTALYPAAIDRHEQEQEEGHFPLQVIALCIHSQRRNDKNLTPTKKPR